MNDMLTVDNIHTFIGQFHILEGVTVQVPHNTITVMLGRNGAGKTTTLRSIMGLNPIKQGEIIFKDQSIGRMRPYRIADLGIGYVPEHRAIFRDLTVEENLKIAERKRGDFANRAPFVFDLFPDLKRLYHLGGGQLSGGQQQMLTIARALIPDNTLLLIDEPSEGLAPIIIERIIEAIEQLSKHETTVLLVEQNFRMASLLAEYFVIVEEGCSVASGKMADLVNDKEMIHRYLGAA
ncbi:MAG: ATP-binding cassette domain-containing protein [Chloroflexi bacterium]|nr:ATP-binding cassette domain-containing protein [Chloroflexota bacterium]